MTPGCGVADRESLPRPGEIYLEYIPFGRQLRVVAIDASTGTEVTVIGPSTATAEDIGRIAARKLKRRLDREAGLSPG